MVTGEASMGSLQPTPLNLLTVKSAAQVDARTAKAIRVDFMVGCQKECLVLRFYSRARTKEDVIRRCMSVRHEIPSALNTAGAENLLEAQNDLENPVSSDHWIAKSVRVR